MQIKLKDGTMVEVKRVDESTYNGEPQVMVTLKLESYTVAELDKLFTNNCDPMEVYTSDGKLVETLTGYIRPRVQKHFEDDTVTLTVVIFTK